MNKIFACLFSVALLSTSALYTSISFASSTPEQTDTQKLADVEAAIKDLNRQLNDIKVQRTELEKQLEKSDNSINDTMKRVEELKSQIKEKQKQAGALTSGKKN